MSYKKSQLQFDIFFNMYVHVLNMYEHYVSNISLDNFTFYFCCCYENYHTERLLGKAIWNFKI